MKKINSLALVTCFAASVSPAFAGSYQVSGEVLATASADCPQVTVTGTEIFVANEHHKADPAHPANTSQGFNTSTSSADVLWIPAYAGETPYDFNVKQKFRVTGDLVATRTNLHAQASASADTRPAITNHAPLFIGAGGTDYSNLGKSTHYVLEDYYVNGLQFIGTTFPTTVSTTVSVQAEVNAQAYYNGEAVVRSQFSNETLTMQMVFAPTYTDG